MKVSIYGLLTMWMAGLPWAMAEPERNVGPETPRACETCPCPREAVPCPEKGKKPAKSKASPRKRRPAEAQRGKKGHPRRDGRRPPHDGWRRLDLDRDGRVSYEEFAANPRLTHVPDDRKRAIFRRIDKNGDGWIQPRELRPPGFARREAMMRLRELDANRDGKIDYEEFSRGKMVKRLSEEKRQAIFRRMDRNGDGVLSPLDHPKHHSHPPQRPPHPPSAHPHPPQGPSHHPPGVRPRPPKRPSNGAPRWLHVPMKRLDRDRDGGVDFNEFSETPGSTAKMPEKRRRAIFEKLDRDGDGKIRRDEAPNWNKPTPMKKQATERKQ